MLPQQRKVPRTATQGCTRILAVVRSHLRFMWMTLMALTVLCVAFQILGIALQSRGDASVKQLADEKLFSRQITVNFLTSSTTDPKRSQTRVFPHVTSRGHTVAVERNEGSDRVTPSKMERRVWTSRALPHRGETSLSVQTLRRTAAKSTTTESRKGKEEMAATSSPLLQRSHTTHQVESDPTNRRVQIHPSTRAGLQTAAEKKTCQPKTHVVFLKTHKTASSTILNILYRYGDARNLTFALPAARHTQLFYPHYFAAHFVEDFRKKKFKEFNIMCNHMRFMASEVKKVMPDGTFYFSILRNPVSMMESIFNYYRSIPAFQKAKSLDMFLDNAWSDFNASVPNNHYAKNVLTFDFGFNNTVDGPEVARHASLVIRSIRRTFHLVLIAEYFDESMVLLKEALCWTLDDVVSFRLNSRSEGARRALSPTTEEKVKAWSALDWKLYRYFNSTFWWRVDTTLGREALQREVERLRERRAQHMELCLQEGAPVDPSKVKDVQLKPFQYGAAVIQGYNLKTTLEGESRHLCQNLITPELQYTAALYRKQFP